MIIKQSHTLLVHHGITVSVRTLKRRLKSNNLGKKKINVDEDLVRNIIRSEMQGPGQLAGYRKMWHILRIKHHVHAPRRLVAQILHELDPDGTVGYINHMDLTSVGISMVRSL